MQNIFNIMSGNSAVLECSSSLPPPSHSLLQSAHTVSLVVGSWTLFSLCFFCFFLSSLSPVFPPLSFLLSPSISLSAHSLSPWYLSPLRPPRRDNSPSVRGSTSGPGTMVRLCGSRRITGDSGEGGRTERNISQEFFLRLP